MESQPLFGLWILLHFKKCYLRTSKSFLSVWVMGVDVYNRNED